MFTWLSCTKMKPEPWSKQRHNLKVQWQGNREHGKPLTMSMRWGRWTRTSARESRGESRVERLVGTSLTLCSGRRSWELKRRRMQTPEVPIFSQKAICHGTGGFAIYGLWKLPSFYACIWNKVAWTLSYGCRCSSYLYLHSSLQFHWIMFSKTLTSNLLYFQSSKRWSDKLSSVPCLYNKTSVKVGGEWRLRKFSLLCAIRLTVLTAFPQADVDTIVIIRWLIACTWTDNHKR